MFLLLLLGGVGGGDSFGSVLMNLTAAPSPPRLQVVLFSCPVRGSHTQVLQVNNSTNEECRIVPVLKGGPWRLEPFLDFEPLENKMVSISYQPMTMAADGKKDLVGGALHALRLPWSCSDSPLSLSGFSLFFLP